MNQTRKPISGLNTKLRQGEQAAIFKRGGTIFNRDAAIFNRNTLILQIAITLFLQLQLHF